MEISKEEELQIRRSRIPKRTEKQRQFILAEIRKDTERLREMIKKLEEGK